MDTIKIEKLGHLGDGIAAGPVYAARTLPGEVVSGVRDGNRIAAPKIVTPSADRVTAGCPHYAACGGCALMHASDSFMAGFKTSVVVQALAAHGIGAKVTGIATSPPETRRRAVLSGRRTKKGALVGFHARASDTITAVPACRVLMPQIRAALPVLEALVVVGGSRKAELSLAVTHGPAGLDVAVAGGKPLDRELRETLSQIAGQADLARLSWGDELVAQERPPLQDMGGVQVIPPPGAFLQATKAGEAALLDAVGSIVRGADRVIDLFAGCGTFALPLSRGSDIHAVEGLRALSDATLAGWRKAGGLHKLTVETRDLFERPVLPIELKSFDAAVIDPPRAGAEAQMQALADSPIATIASVSCNPVSFARDAAIAVKAGFEIRQLLVVDQFRWSPHVEIVAHLAR
ncbi:class I SAM-dependent RNA methyltransferase [Maribius pontilimi]|uniref:Class I SAM-dependent RNA methyltransferase n=1 Tax=Palleronia pontilimi TaxID=1964209 RepID=A0A934I9J2_9RHOB|nr:class I SAM-dependent RNA methyltransferase [Palleronia pontilimi]MBJ3761571.1 class I SAM-dependent RNA methyltransferase [Palleronia pontilimi]